MSTKRDLSIEVINKLPVGHRILITKVVENMSKVPVECVLVGWVDAETLMPRRGFFSIATGDYVCEY